MKTNQEYKNAALAALKGHWGPAVLATFAMGVLGCVPSLLAESENFVVLIIGLAFTFLVALPFSVGYYASTRKFLVEGDDKMAENMLVLSFRNWTRNIVGMLLMGIFTFLWMLLLIIPGVIKAFSYAQTPFILNDKPELPANEAINLSMKMMDGHKLDLFLLELSFIGWYLLGILTLCIGYLWIVPYQYTTMAVFYEDVKAEYEAKQQIAA